MIQEFTVAVKIENVTLDIKTIDDIEHRKVVIKLARDFDDTIAAALGGDAKQILTSLRRHGQEKAYINIDRLNAKAILVAPKGEKVTIPALHGTTAVAVAGKDDEPPLIRLEVDFFYDHDAWAFMGQHARGTVEITFKQRQQELL
jgi:hypothetical protein